MARLLSVVSRLPVTLAIDGGPHLVPSSGGLATAVRGLHERSGGVWIGWAGDTSKLDSAQCSALERELAARHTVAIELAHEETRRSYEAFSNEVLWPLFHYRLDRMPLRVQNWDAYVRVNERFAEAVASQYRPGDLVWVHDYQLMLVPALLRQRVPEAHIGFFLHIPFPSSEVFRTLPNRGRLLDGLLGADLIGFHTAAYARHFGSALKRTLGLEVDVDRVPMGERDVAIGVFPMGVDAEHLAALARSPQVAAEVKALRGGDQCALLVGIDRLDYTKGIPRRLLAFEQLLRTQPSLRERVRLLQISMPSRTQIEAYQEFRRDVEQLVGRVNGSFATPRWTPISYVFRSVPEAELVALYRAADVMLVTPVRDGMNLVAKEFVAARADEDGVLVLSEFAGVAAEFAEALQLNPYDVDHAADVYRRALELSADERRARMRGLRRRVFTYDVHHWAHSFVRALEAASARPAPAGPARLESILRRLSAAGPLVLVLDYDGTLVPLATAPELAAPDGELLDLLDGLARRPETRVHVTSGRAAATLDRWLGALPIDLHAEDGLWSRPAGGAWVARPAARADWMERVLPILKQVTERTPGSLIEEKTSSLAWHYRAVEPDFGTRQANELRLHLSEVLSNAPVEILTGEQTIEVRPHEANKGALVAALLADCPPGTTVVALGDGRADEDVFAALPPGGITIHVGPSRSRAEFRLADIRDARRLLAAMLAG